MKKSVLITGATGKLGKIYVRHFLEIGHEVIALSKTLNNLQKLKDNFQIYHENLKIICLDLMRDKFEIELINKLKDLNTSPDFLINNARSISNLKINESGLVSEEAMLNEYKLGVVVPYKIVMSLANKYTGDLKRVINVASIYGVVAPNLMLYKNFDKESPIHYGLAKASLIQLTKELAVRLANRKILVNCIAYGGLEGRADLEFQSKYSKLCPSGRMLTEKEISKPLEILLSDGTEGINGHVLMVDGGWTIW